MNLAVFHNHGNHWMAPVLKKGFKHVFAVIDDGLGFYIMVDGRDGVPAVEVVTGTDRDLKAFYEAKGYTVVEVPEGNPTRWPFVLSNCVGMAKTVLGVRAFGVLTPRQLYRRLTK